jgi:hypothetical protein
MHWVTVSSSCSSATAHRHWFLANAQGIGSQFRPYKASKEVVEEALKADPTCGIAYWGIALGLVDNPHFGPSPANLPLGLAAIQAAKATGAKTQRELDYIDALSHLYVDYDKLNRDARVHSYLSAMEALAARYPEDDEAQMTFLSVERPVNDATTSGLTSLRRATYIDEHSLCIRQL